MAHLYHPGVDPTRVYEGTDTRAFGLLVGAALAMVWPTRMSRPALRRSVRSPALLDAVGLVGLIVILLLVWRTSSLSSFLYPTGMILLSLATAAVMAAVVNPSSTLGEVLGCRPMRWIGVRSYGIYLWHWPIIVLWGAPHTGVQLASGDPPGGGVICRGGAVVALRRGADPPGGAGAAARAVALAGRGDPCPAPRDVDLGDRRARGVAGRGRPRRRAAGSVQRPQRAPEDRKAAAEAVGRRLARPTLRPTTHPAKKLRRPPRPRVARSSTSATRLPRARPRPTTSPTPASACRAQLKRVGVKTLYPEISGARSIVETYEGFPNAATVAQDHVDNGYQRLLDPGPGDQ